MVLGRDQGRTATHVRCQMWQLKSEVLLIAATFACASCGGGMSGVPTAPTGVSDQRTSASITAAVVQPSTAAPVTSSNDAGHPPIGISAVSNNCQTQSTDPFGIDMSRVTLPAPVPTVQFGSRLAEVRGKSAGRARRGQQRPVDCFR
jgi:hypothetical protein